MGGVGFASAYFCGADVLIKSSLREASEAASVLSHNTCSPARSLWAGVFWALWPRLPKSLRESLSRASGLDEQSVLRL